MAVMDGEGSVTWITVAYVGAERCWEAHCEGLMFLYPVDSCASVTPAIRRGLSMSVARHHRRPTTMLQ